ncbi:Rhs family protein [Pseudomonas sp. FW300-N1A1]|uniref:RHS repeat-associated core domain-containing protein n=1 Tax=Pseudomonas sp. FW300-N1A1 TaxID=2075555 RepID=UPI000CD06B3B|nr:RHS repeat-associated core domain-containing protein [Pseudomonas sp. FW300-N1A1]POA19080.1 Rhs family protein [Pseudomonas sp. FW300-N1A1]
MPSSSRLTELCRYHYDPLDRQAGCTLTLVQPATLQRFYCKSRLATEIHGAVQTSLFQHDDQLLAQQRHQNDKVDTTLLTTDQQRSVLSALDTIRPHPLAYTPYGHRPAENGLLSLLGFNGERSDPVTGHYHLGNGYRQFNPVLMRFNSPDSWSPFGQGGLNAYAYCDGEPVLGSDPTGHFNPFKAIRSFGKGTANLFGLRVSGKELRAAAALRSNSSTAGTSNSTASLNQANNTGTEAYLNNIANQLSPEENMLNFRLEKQHQSIKSTHHQAPPTQTPKSTTPSAEQSYKEYISTAPNEELINSHHELLDSIKLGAFPRELKISIAMENEIIRRFASK